MNNSLKISGENHPRWKGGRYINFKGYVLILSKNHPNRNYHGYVLEHRLVMEKKLKRYLTKNEIIHHLNGIKTDNRICNLKLCSSNLEHRKLERTMKKLHEKNVQEIRELLDKVPIIQIARIFNVTRVCIENVRDGRTWGWLK